MNSFEQFCIPDPERKDYEIRKRIKRSLMDSILSGKKNSKNRLLKIQHKIQ